jgi:carbohydrate diacid regulator
MKLLPKLAAKIVSEVQQVINEDIIVVDTNSIIVASTEEGRVGTFHEGAQRVLRSKHKLYIHQTMARELKGVREGINMPIMFEERVIGVIGVTGDPKEVEPYAELTRRMTELIIREAHYAEQIEWKTRGLDAYFYEWVNLTSVDQEFMDRGVMLGIPIHNTYVCCLIQLGVSALHDHESQWMQREVFELFQRFFQTENDFIIRWGQGRFLLLKSANPDFSRSRFHYQLEQFQQSFQNRYKSTLSVGVGKTPGTHVIHRSYREAKKALKVAGKQGSIVFYEDLVIDIILEEVPVETQEEFLDRTIHTLIEQKELIETLQSYLRNNQSIKGTAAEMHLHINTLHYRLKQIKELTGIDPKETEGIVLFHLAMLFLKSSDKYTKSTNENASYSLVET